MFGLKVPWLVLLPIVFLLALGSVVLLSISRTSRIDIDFSFATQMISLGLAIIAGLVSFKVRDSWYRLAPLMYFVSLLLLIAVLVYAEPIGGAQRWLSLGSFQLQPSELAKIAIILIQARLLTSRAETLNAPWPVGLSALYVGVVALLILVQPDLGTMIIIVAIWLAQLMVSRLPKRTFVLVLGLVLLALPASYPFMADYQKERIETFFNPSLSTNDEGYNVLQASIAVGSGGLLGKGLDAGTQSQLNFLPAQHTDFIFAVIGEKLGFVGAVSVVIAFSTLILALWSVAYRSESMFGRLIGVGVITAIGLQFVINVGMNIGLTPVTGVPLPFVSGGGSHIIAEMIMIGLLLGVAKNRD